MTVHTQIIYLDADSSGNISGTFPETIIGKVLKVGHVGLFGNLTNTGSLSLSNDLGETLYYTDGTLSGAQFINARVYEHDTLGAVAAGSPATPIPIGPYDLPLEIWASGCGANKSGLILGIWWED
jgi:hypothetical protein